MADFVSVAKVSEVPSGQVKQVELGDKTQICLANVDGVFYAIGGKCTTWAGRWGKAD